MKPLWLYLPVWLVGIPVLGGLVVAASPWGKSTTPANRVLQVVSVADDGTELPEPQEFERLAAEDPIAFIDACLRRYQRDVKGYQLTMQKQERLQVKLHPKEIIDVSFRESPHSVLMRWVQGARKAERVLYVAGENNGKMLVRPTGLIGRFAGVVPRDVDGADAKQSGRYTLDNYGIKKGTERTRASWSAARERGKLHVEYLGEHRIKEAGDRLCYRLRRTHDQPENDGVMEVTIYVDKETWLQVGSVLKGDGGKLIGEYFFRDIKLNPQFSPNHFQRSSLER